MNEHLFEEDDIEKFLIGNLLDGNEEEQQQNKLVEKIESKENSQLDELTTIVNGTFEIFSADGQYGYQHWPKFQKKALKESLYSPAAHQPNHSLSLLAIKYSSNHMNLSLQFWPHPQEQKAPINGFYDYGQEYQAQFATNAHLNGFRRPSHFAKNRYVSESHATNVSNYWPRGENNSDEEIFDFKQRRPKFLTRSKSFNHQQTHPAKFSYSRTFHRTNPKKEMNIALTEKNVRKDEQSVVARQQLTPQSPNVVVLKKPSTPVVPIGFCPIEKKKTNQEKRKQLNGRTKEEKPSFDGIKKKDSPIKEFQTSNKTRTISLQNAAKNLNKIVEEGGILQPTLLDNVQTTDKFTPVGRFQILSRIGGLSDSNVVSKLAEAETMSKSSRQRRANSVASVPVLPAKTTIVAKKISAEYSSQKNEPISIFKFWNKLLGILLTIFPIFVPFLNNIQSTDFLPFKNAASINPVTEFSCKLAQKQQQKGLLKKQNVHQNIFWKLNLDRGKRNNLIIFTIFGWMMDSIWKTFAWIFNLLWAFIQRPFKAIFISYKCLYGKIIGKS